MGSIIEINGKKYDAITGKIISASSDVKKASSVKKSATRTKSKSMDGFISHGRASRLKQTQRTTTKKPTTASKKSAKPVKSTAAGTLRKSRGAKNTAKKPQKSQTLMRTAVKKPTAKPAKKTRVISKSKLGASKTRVQKAEQTARSPHVSKFAASQSEPLPVVKKIQHLPVKQPAQKTQQQKKITRPRKSAALRVGKTASQKTIQKKNVAAAKMIESALEQSSSHREPAQAQDKQPSSLAHKIGISTRALSISAAVLAVLAFGSFIAIQNVPNISMRVAATRAGFDATLPRYNPSGFSFRGPINYSSGQVTITFKSNTDERTYDLTQRTSNWNSQALLENFVAIDDNPYQSFEDKGRTLYIYGDSNATWVDNGIWYQIEGDSRMSTDQLIRVAASM